MKKEDFRFAIGERVKRNNGTNLPNNARYREGVVIDRTFKPANKFRPGINETPVYDIRWEDRSQTDPVTQARLLPINE